MLHHLMTNLLLSLLIAAPAFAQLEGPASEVPPPDRTKPYANWHEWANWRAENYFADPQAIAMCKAIEANDLDEMKRLLDAGFSQARFDAAVTHGLPRMVELHNLYAYGLLNPKGLYGRPLEDYNAN